MPTNVGPASLQKCVGDFCCVNFGGFCRGGFSWRIFPGTFCPQKWEKNRWQNPRENPAGQKIKSTKIRSAKIWPKKWHHFFIWESRMGGFQEGGFSNSWTCCVFFAWISVLQGNSCLKSTLHLLLRRRVWGQICYLKNPPSENPPLNDLIFPFFFCAKARLRKTLRCHVRLARLVGLPRHVRLEGCRLKRRRLCLVAHRESRRALC